MGIESSVSDKERMREIIHKQEERWSQSNKEAGTPVPLKELPPSPALSPSWKYARQLGSSWEFWGVFRSRLPLLPCAVARQRGALASFRGQQLGSNLKPAAQRGVSAGAGDSDVLGCIYRCETLSNFLLLAVKLPASIARQ